MSKHSIGLLLTTCLSYSSIASAPLENTQPGISWWASLLLLGAVILLVALLILWNTKASPAPAAHAEAGHGHESHSTASADDFKVIEGIGPKISALLHSAGIASYEQLSKQDVYRLRELLHGAGLQIADPTTWAEQARLAANGDWEGLDRLQEMLKGGRRVV